MYNITSLVLSTDPLLLESFFSIKPILPFAYAHIMYSDRTHTEQKTLYSCLSCNTQKACLANPTWLHGVPNPFFLSGQWKSTEKPYISVIIARTLQEALVAVVSSVLGDEKSNSLSMTCSFFPVLAFIVSEKSINVPEVACCFCMLLFKLYEHSITPSSL